MLYEVITKIRFRPINDALRALLEPTLRLPLATFLEGIPDAPVYQDFCASLTRFMDVFVRFVHSRNNFV